MMLGLAEHRRLTCPGCGGWLPETTTTDATQYEVSPPHRCGACTQLSVVQTAQASDHKHSHALRWPVRRRT